MDNFDVITWLLWWVALVVVYVIGRMLHEAAS